MGIFDLFKPNVEKMKAKKDVEGLTKVLRDKDGYVRSDTAIALTDIALIGIEVTRIIDELIYALESDQIESSIRDEIAHALIKIGEPAVEPLIEYLSWGDSPFGLSGAASALGGVGDERAVGPLSCNLGCQTAVNVTCSYNPYDRSKKYGNGYLNLEEESAHALVKIGEPAVEILIEILEQGSESAYPSRIREAAWALGKIGDVRAIEPLTHALKDNDSLVQKAAKEALDKIKVKKSESLEKEGSPELDKKQKDPVQICWKFLDEYNEKVDAIWDGGALGDESLDKLEQSFIQWIDKLDHSDRSIAVLEAIISPQNMKMWSDIHTAANRKYNEFLATEEKVKPEDTESTKYNKEVETLINNLKDGDENIRWVAASTLDGIGWVPRNRTEKGYYTIANKRTHIPLLISNLSEVGWEICSGAADDLGEIAEFAPDLIESFIPDLISNLSDGNILVSGGGALAIVKISERCPEVLKSVVPNLIGFLDAKDEKVRRSSVFAIGMIGGKDSEVAKSVIPKLIDFLDDDDEYVRMNAVEGINKIREKNPEIVKDAENKVRDK